jgi:hypothetical protein
MEALLIQGCTLAYATLLLDLKLQVILSQTGAALHSTTQHSKALTKQTLSDDALFHTVRQGATKP